MGQQLFFIGPAGVDAKNHTTCNLRFRFVELIQPKKEPSNNRAQSKGHKDLVTREKPQTEEKTRGRL